MLVLDLMQHSSALKTRVVSENRQIFDPVRRKWVAFQPEEMVRQLLIMHLHHAHMISYSRMSVEKAIAVNAMSRRYDLVVYDRNARPWLLAECKSPQTKLDQSTMDQVAGYNLKLRVPYLLMCNGPEAWCCKIDFATESWVFIDTLPEES